MASGHSSCIRIIRRGFVHVICGDKNLQMKYLKAVCGDNGDQSAKLEVYEDFDSASRERPIICKIEFTNVNNVSYIEERQMKIIAIRMQKSNTNFLFYAEPQCDTVKWYQCCVLLFEIPKYGIPEIPKEKTALEQDTANKSIVNILSEGVGKGLINKLCAVTMCDRNSTFNIYTLDDGKILLSWHRSGIGLSGYIGSVVFVEVDETCHRGPGCLWMKSLIPNSMTFQRQIYNFYTGHKEQIKTPSPIDYIFVDSVLSGLSTKDNGDKPSQASYEHEVSESDVLVSGNTSIPISNPRTSRSSGYYSGSSYMDGPVSLKSIQPPFPESTGRVLLNQVNKQGMNEELSAPSIATLPNQDTHETIEGKMIHSSSNSSENASMCTQREFASSTSSYKTQPYSKESLNSCKKNISNTQTLLVDSSAHKSIYAMPKSIRPHPSNGQGSKLTPCLSLRQRESTFQKCSVEIVNNLDAVEITPVTGIVVKMGADTCGAIDPKEDPTTLHENSSHPDLPNLVEHVGSFVSTKWYNLGLRLGVNECKLDSIEHDVRECDKACRKMFQAWLRDNCNGTWNDVIAALRSNSVKEDGIADKLKEMIVT